MKIIAKKYFLFYVLLGLVIISSGCQGLARQSDPKNDDEYVVILSLDAFRWDYPDIAKTPNLNSIAQNGVKAQVLIPCYPSKTFPNHYSMATGLYPDNHGIVENRFFDPNLGFYSIGDRNAVENPAFYGGEPFWATAEAQGLIAATYFWVGSETAIGGSYPSFWKKYDSSVTMEQKIDTVIHWLNLPINERPRVIAWYSDEPDLTAHRNGATGTKTIAVVERLDSLLGVFLTQLNELPHANKINFIVVSDHGMADISPSRYINLNKYVNRDWFSVISGGNPVYSLTPKAEYRDQAIAALKSIPNLKVWERHEVPKRLHYGSNPRIQDVIIEAEAGYSVGLSNDSSRYVGGAHGYDNENPDMHGIFFAQGPSFKKGYTSKSFINTNIYNIITHILNLQPAKNDGNWDDVKDIFKN
ncbi:MAG: ectonucleotide pyrophosphatase/phosphodiesterase [Bacteroidales bacterium]